jgi:hypothetical protein
LSEYRSTWFPEKRASSHDAAIGFVYTALNLIAFIVYAFDKSAARNGAWRTPEISLSELHHFQPAASPAYSLATVRSFG